MAYTQTQRDELEAAIASGALSVKHGDKLVTYRSLEEMRRILSLMDQQLAGVTAAPRMGVIRHDRGTNA